MPCPKGSFPVFQPTSALEVLSWSFPALMKTLPAIPAPTRKASFIFELHTRGTAARQGGVSSIVSFCHGFFEVNSPVAPFISLLQTPSSIVIHKIAPPRRRRLSAAVSSSRVSTASRFRPIQPGPRFGSIGMQTETRHHPGR